MSGKNQACQFLRRVPIKKSRGVTLFLPVEQLDWIEASNQYVKLHSGRSGHLIRISMAQLQASLDPNLFKRLHRSVIVNLERVSELCLETPSRRWAVLRSGRRLPVSPQHWDGLHDELVGGRFKGF